MNSTTGKAMVLAIMSDGRSRNCREIARLVSAAPERVRHWLNYYALTGALERITTPDGKAVYYKIAKEESAL